MIDDPLGRIDYDESGDGPILVFVPGSCSTGAAWRPVIAALGGGFRCVTTSLPGYGGTAERRMPDDAPMSSEAEVIEAVVRRAAGPREAAVHLVGHSFGGLAALAVALRGRVRLSGLVIVEAPAPGVLSAFGEQHHYRAFHDMTERYFAAFAEGRRDAIAIMIDFYGGAGTFSAWPARLRDYVVATTAVNIRDWASAYGFVLAPRLLHRLDLPVRVVCGADSHPAVKRANQLLNLHLPEASWISIPGAAHFMIATHANRRPDRQAVRDHGCRQRPANRSANAPGMVMTGLAVK
jgi:pimeloyl-ACP methyl ester carboxylesterase